MPRTDPKLTEKIREAARRLLADAPTATGQEIARAAGLTADQGDDLQASLLSTTTSAEFQCFQVHADGEEQAFSFWDGYDEDLANIHYRLRLDENGRVPPSWAQFVKAESRAGDGDGAPRVMGALEWRCSNCRAHSIRFERLKHHDLCYHGPLQVRRDMQPRLQELLSEHNKKAAKLGVGGGLKFRVIREFTVSEHVFVGTATAADPFGDVCKVPGCSPKGDPSHWLDAPYVEIQLDGEVPKLPGWSILGRIESTPGGNLVLEAPGQKIPARYRTEASRCDHCNLKRNRNDTIVIQKGDKIVQVGRNCLRDFIGTTDAEEMVRMFLAFSAKWKEIMDRVREGGGSEGGPRYEGMSLRDLLQFTAASVRKAGFVSKAYAERSEFRRKPTADDVREAYMSVKFRGKQDEDPRTPADVATAATAAEWISSMIAVPGEASTFDHNLAVLARGGWIPDGKEGFGVSLFEAWRKAHGLSDPKEVKLNSYRDEGIGETITIRARVAMHKERATEGYNVFRDLYKLRDEQGRTLVLWTPSADQSKDGRRYPPQDGRPTTGAKVIVTVKIKSKKEYQDKLETQVTMVGDWAFDVGQDLDAPAKERAEALIEAQRKAKEERGEPEPTAGLKRLAPLPRPATVREVLAEAWRRAVKLPWRAAPLKPTKTKGYQQWAWESDAWTVVAEEMAAKRYGFGDAFTLEPIDRRGGRDVVTQPATGASASQALQYLAHSDEERPEFSYRLATLNGGDARSVIDDVIFAADDAGFPVNRNERSGWGRRGGLTASWEEARAERPIDPALVEVLREWFRLLGGFEFGKTGKAALERPEKPGKVKAAKVDRAVAGEVAGGPGTKDWAYKTAEGWDEAEHMRIVPESKLPAPKKGKAAAKAKQVLSRGVKPKRRTVPATHVSERDARGKGVRKTQARPARGLGEERQAFPLTFSRPVTSQELTALNRTIHAGTLSFANYMAGYQALLESKAEVLARWNAKSKKELGPNAPSGVTKKDLVESLWKRWLGVFDILPVGEAHVYSMSQIRKPYDDLVAEHVAGMTEAKIEKINAARIADNAKRQAQADEEAAQLAEPRTLDDYRLLARRIGVSKMTAEQRLRMEELEAEASLDAAAARRGPRQIEVAASDLGWHVVPTWHFRQSVPTWTVRKETKGKDIPKDEFMRLAAAARALSGKWERFTKKEGEKQALAGFLFFNETSANKFRAALAGESVDNAEEVERRQERADSNRAENLAELAERTRADAEDALGQDRKTNTAKRAREAASQEGRARGAIGFAGSLERISDAISNGTAKFLRGVAHKTHVETLDRILRRAQSDIALQVKHDMSSGTSVATDDQRARYKDAYRDYPVSFPDLVVADVEGVKYPWPHFYASVLTSIVRDVEKKAGCKLLAGRIKKVIARHSKGQEEGRETFTIVNKDELEMLQDLAKCAPKSRVVEDLEDYNRVQAMGLTTLPMLRSALREYLGCCKGVAPKEDPIRAQERALIGRQYPGYFPTPADLADEVVARAGVRNGMRVLEPSAGKGSLVEAVLRAAPDAQVDVVEKQYDLRQILQAKGFNIIGSDIMEIEPVPTYDRIVANPPFEENVDIDHVMRMYELLRPGGRIVSIMGNGSLTNSGRKVVEFRQWLAERNGTHTKNEDGAFLSSDRPTGVASQTVVINKPAEAPSRAVSPAKQRAKDKTREALAAGVKPRGQRPEAARVTERDKRGRGRRRAPATRKFQPYFVEYARAMGREPEDLADGNQHAFAAWMGERWQEWRTMNGLPSKGALSDKQHEQFAAWLSGGRPGLAPGEPPDGLTVAQKARFDGQQAEKLATLVRARLDQEEQRTRAAGRDDYLERKEARIDRLESGAARAAGESEARYRRAGEGLPDNGQPLLVGHHSEKGHRAAMDRANNNMRASIEAGKEAQELKGRAVAARDNKAISSDDPEALERLKEKLEKLTTKREAFKAINKAIRARDPGAELAALGYKPTTVAKLIEGKGIADYELTNIGATVREVKRRIAELEGRAETAAPDPVERGDYLARWDSESNRVVVEVPRSGGRVERDRRSGILSNRGFKWAESLGHYQRLANDSAWHAAIAALAELAPNDAPVYTEAALAEQAARAEKVASAVQARGPYSRRDPKREDGNYFADLDYNRVSLYLPGGRGGKPPKLPAKSEKALRAAGFQIKYGQWRGENTDAMWRIACALVDAFAAGGAVAAVTAAASGAVEPIGDDGHEREQAQAARAAWASFNAEPPVSAADAKTLRGEGVEWRRGDYRAVHHVPPSKTPGVAIYAKLLPEGSEARKAREKAMEKADFRWSNVRRRWEPRPSRWIGSTDADKWGAAVVLAQELSGGPRPADADELAAGQKKFRRTMAQRAEKPSTPVIRKAQAEVRREQVRTRDRDEMAAFMADQAANTPPSKRRGGGWGLHRMPGVSRLPATATEVSQLPATTATPITAAEQPEVKKAAEKVEKAKREKKAVERAVKATPPKTAAAKKASKVKVKRVAAKLTAAEKELAARTKRAEARTNTKRCALQVAEKSARKGVEKAEREAARITVRHAKVLATLNEKRKGCKKGCRHSAKRLKVTECKLRPTLQDLARKLQELNAQRQRELTRHAAAVRELAAMGEPTSPLTAPEAKRSDGAPPKRKGCGTVCHIDMLGGICGGQAAVVVPGRGTAAPLTIDTRYCAVEGDLVVSSHDPLTFEPDPRYPEGVQERRYDRRPEEQAKVLGIARSPKPEIIINTSASPLDGLPIVTPTGIVLGGNGRSMGWRLANAKGDTTFTDYLLRNAAEFGFTAAQLRKFKNPIVVRVIDPPQAEWSRWVRDLNQGLTQVMDSISESVSLARQMPQAALDALAVGLGEGEDMDTFFTSKASGRWASCRA